MIIYIYLFPGLVLRIFNSNVTTKCAQLHYFITKYWDPVSSLVRTLEGKCTPLKLGPWTQLCFSNHQAI